MFKQPFNPQDWYWIINDDDTAMWSSDQQKYVSHTDEKYMFWTASGKIPTKISSLDNLKALLLSYNLAVPA